LGRRPNGVNQNQQSHAVEIQQDIFEWRLQQVYPARGDWGTAELVRDLTAQTGLAIRVSAREDQHRFDAARSTR
jgi:hypothetical protein